MDEWQQQQQQQQQQRALAGLLLGGGGGGQQSPNYELLAELLGEAEESPGGWGAAPPFGAVGGGGGGGQHRLPTEHAQGQWQQQQQQQQQQQMLLEYQQQVHYHQQQQVYHQQQQQQQLLLHYEQQQQQQQQQQQRLWPQPSAKQVQADHWLQLQQHEEEHLQAMLLQHLLEQEVGLGLQPAPQMQWPLLPPQQLQQPSQKGLQQAAEQARELAVLQQQQQQQQQQVPEQQVLEQQELEQLAQQAAPPAEPPSQQQRQQRRTRQEPQRPPAGQKPAAAAAPAGPAAAAQGAHTSAGGEPGTSEDKAAEQPPATRAAGRRQAPADGGLEAAIAELDHAMANEPMSRFKRNRLRSKQNMLAQELTVQRKMAEAALLAEENQALRLRSKALEVVLAVRDRHISLLRQFGPPAGPSAAAEAAGELRSTSTSTTASTHSATPMSSSSGPSNSTGTEGSAPPASSPHTPGSWEAGQGGSSGSPHLGVSAGTAPAAAEAAAATPCVVFAGRRSRGVMRLQAGEADASASEAGSGGRPASAPPAFGADFGADAEQPPAPCSDARGGGSASRQRPGGRRAAAAGAPALAPVDWPALLRERLLQLSQHAAAPPPVTAEHCRALTAEEFIRCWKSYAHSAAALLLELEGAATPAAAEAVEARVADLVENYGVSSMPVTVLNPIVIMRACTTDMESGRAGVNPHEQGAHWLRAVLGLRLRPAQRAVFLEIFELVARDMLAVSRRRKRLFAEVFSMASSAAAAAAAAAGEAPATDGGGGGGDAAQQHLPPVLRKLLSAVGVRGRQARHAVTHDDEFPQLSASLLDMLGRIQASTQREILAAITLNASFVEELLDPVQVARLVVLSYPLFPNALSMAAALAKSTGWKPKKRGEALARGGLTRLPKCSPWEEEQHQQQQQQEKEEEEQQQQLGEQTEHTTAACAGAQALGAAPARRASERSAARRAREQQQQQQQQHQHQQRQCWVLGSAGGLVTARPGAAARAAAAGGSGGEGSEEDGGEDEDDCAQLPDVTEMMQQVHVGRVAAASAVAQASQQAAQLAPPGSGPMG